MLYEVSKPGVNFLAVAGACGRYFVAMSTPPRVAFWDPQVEESGEQSLTDHVLVDNTTAIINARFINKDVAVIIYPNTNQEAVIGYYQAQKDYQPPLLIRTVSTHCTDAKKVFVFNNVIAVVSCNLEDNNYIFSGTPAINPVTNSDYELPPYISKAKVIYDNLFVFAQAYIQYTNDGTSWKSIYYPFSVASSYYLNVKPFASDGKVFLNNEIDTIYADIFGSDADGLVRNTTITHNAPLAHGVSLDDFEIGGCVYMSGSVFKFNEMTRLYETTTDVTDCISSVKSKGTAREYLGICCRKLKRGERNIGQDTVEFSSHGDCYFKVDDADQYEIGDVVLIDRSILGESVIITGLIKRMIVGKVTSKINKKYISVFMD
jgi:hypothetical protein